MTPAELRLVAAKITEQELTKRVSQLKIELSTTRIALNDARAELQRAMDALCQSVLDSHEQMWREALRDKAYAEHVSDPRQ